MAVVWVLESSGLPFNGRHPRNPGRDGMVWDLESSGLPFNGRHPRNPGRDGRLSWPYESQNGLKENIYTLNRWSVC